MPTNLLSLLVGFFLILCLFTITIPQIKPLNSLLEVYSIEYSSTLDNLKNYALSLINEDRSEFGLTPLLPSNNSAAQIHANELLRTESISHITTSGFKPYMLYSLYNGTGYMQQNVGQISYVLPDDNLTNQKSSDLCKNYVKIPCPIIDHFKAVENLQYSMMYNDSICCNDGHRNNILNEFHTHVSIGIAFNQYYFVIVQNFENHYLDPNFLFQKDSKKIKLKAKILNPNKFNFTINHVSFFLDKYPTKLDYEKNRDKNNYDLGDLEFMVSKPLPSDKEYLQVDEGYKIIEAKKWELNKDYLDLEFQLPETINVKDKVLTMVLYAENRTIGNNDDDDDVNEVGAKIDYVPLSLYTFF